MTDDLDFQQSLAQLFTLVPYGQLILEQAQLDETPPDIVDLVFETLVRDFSATAIELHGKASSTEAQQQWALDSVRKPVDRRGPRRSRLRRGPGAGRRLRDERMTAYSGARVRWVVPRGPGLPDLTMIVFLRRNSRTATLPRVIQVSVPSQRSIVPQIVPRTVAEL